ncbi:MAG: TIGR03621 family F420-dependent LLM class oxidoreductase [Actinobacteria bacterium]|nr:TIGR03621 family F420-dependent LLM class oxidoreductase [Actinomycetota bacterium]
MPATAGAAGAGGPPPFRFSLQAVEARSRREWVELVRRVDGAGFGMIATADHLGGCLAPLLPLATAAEVSDRLRLGVMVLNNDLHHPALLARSAATLDLLSDGRVEIGLGAGHAKPEYDRAGLVFDPAPVRVARLAEAVVVLRRLLDGETVTFSGEHYRLAGERCDPPPVQARVPVLVGGGGRRVHRIAARHADAVGFTGLGRTLPDGQRHDPSGFRAEQVDADVAAVRAASLRRLPSLGPLEHQVLVQRVIVTDDAHGAAERLSRAHLPSLSASDVLTTPYLMVGSTGALADRLVEQRERWGFSHYTVRAEALGQLEPVIAALTGR